MVQLARWLLSRFRRRYFVVIELILDALVAVAVAVFMGVAALYLDLSITEYLVAAGWGALCISLAVRLAIVTLRADLDPIRVWLHDQSTDPTRVWKCALRFPRFGPRRALWFSLPCGLLTLVPLLAFDVDGLGLVAYACSTALIGISTNHNLGVSSRDLMRPIVDEVAPLLPVATAPDVEHLGVGETVGRALFFAGYAAGVSVPAIVLGTAATSRHFAIAVVAAALVSFAIAGDAFNRVAKPLVAPVEDLLDGTDRVRQGDLLQPVVVSSADEFGELALAFNEMQRGLRERAALHAAFGSYVDPALAQRLIESESSVFDGEEVEATLLFLDVRGFTAIADKVLPGEAVELLNALYEVAVPVLHRYGGHTNHYLGDGLLAIFGSPLPLPNHAQCAVASAVEVHAALEARFGDEVRVGIGINSGRVIAGTVGGGGRYEFTVIGDAVNVASRVERLTKETGDPILITDATRRLLTTPTADLSLRGEFVFKGKRAKVAVYAVGSHQNGAITSVRDLDGRS